MSKRPSQSPPTAQLPPEATLGKPDSQFSLFIASSPVELCSALAVIDFLEIKDATILVDHSINLAKDAMAQFCDAALVKNPALRLVHLQLDRTTPQCNVPLLRALRFLNHKKAQIDAVLREQLGIRLEHLGRHVHTIYFDFLHDHCVILLDACRSSRRVLFPHGFDQPRSEQVRGHPALYRRRSWLNALRFRRDYKMSVALCLLGIGLKMTGRLSNFLPFDGVDEVVTFRSRAPKVETASRVLPNLKAVLRGLCELPGWAAELRAWNATLPSAAVLLLLPECNQPRIWEANRNFLQAHAELIRRVTRHVGSSHVVIKAHPRSDTSAAAWLLEQLRESLPGITVELLPGSLHRLPVEALAIAATMAGACSMGSCSLPSDIGIDVPHFVSPGASALFDRGWQQPFWHRYEQGALMLVDEGICRNIDLCPAEPAL